MKPHRYVPVGTGARLRAAAIVALIIVMLVTGAKGAGDNKSGSVGGDGGNASASVGWAAHEMN